MQEVLSKTDEQRYKYIYDVKRASTYINEFNCKVFDIGRHPQTGNVWVKFDFNETKDAYEEWRKRSDTLRNQ